MSPQTIVVENLSKTYQVPEREGGFGAAVRSFFIRKYKDVKAVQSVNFNIAQGEIVDGKIMSVTSTEVFVDIGMKTEAIVPIAEFQTADGTLTVAPGDTHQGVKVISTSGDQAVFKLPSSFQPQPSGSETTDRT